MFIENENEKVMTHYFSHFVLLQNQTRGRRCDVCRWGYEASDVTACYRLCGAALSNNGLVNIDQHIVSVVSVVIYTITCKSSVHVSTAE